MRLVNETKEQGWLPGLTWPKKFIVCTKRNITEFLNFFIWLQVCSNLFKNVFIAPSKNRTYYRFR